MTEKLRITQHDYDWHPKYLHIIVGVFCALYMITTALMPKMVDFWGGGHAGGDHPVPYLLHYH